MIRIQLWEFHLKIDLKTVITSLIVSALCGIAVFYGATQRELGVLTTKIDQLEKELIELKADKKELSDKLAQLSEKVNLLDFRVAVIKPENADISKNIEPTGPKTSIPLDDVIGNP